MVVSLQELDEVQDVIENDQDAINAKEQFHHLKGELIEIELERNQYGFGLALSGHKNRNIMGTFICGIHPKGSAGEEGSLQPGDELLQVKTITLMKA